MPSLYNSIERIRSKRSPYGFKKRIQNLLWYQPSTQTL